MAEAFHQWVNNMPWYEKLYYQLFDPQTITCTTPNFAFPFGWIVLSIMILGVVVIIWILKTGEKKK